MDIPNDVWGQVALEASQLYFTEGGRSPFADTVIFPKKKKFSPFSYYFYQVINLFLILHFRQLKSCPIKFCWTSSRIYRIWRYVEWPESVANGDKLLMILNCGKMFRCVLKFQVSLG